VKYAIRIPANDRLEWDIAEFLTRPVGRPSHQSPVWYKSFLDQAASWKTARRAWRTWSSTVGNCSAVGPKN
jgi:hypothetical protein